MKTLFPIFFALVLVIGWTTQVAAADPTFTEELQKLASENAKGYLGPFVTVFGTSMNSGLYHTAKPHAILGFDISVKITGVAVSDDDKWFDFLLPNTVPVTVPGRGTMNLDANLLYPNRKTPTMFGENISTSYTATEDGLANALLAAGVSVSDVDLLRTSGQLTTMVSQIPVINCPVRGTGLPGAGLVMPQVSLGLPFKTEILGRYFPDTDIDKVGKLTFWGAGVKHSISQWIPVPLMGIDISGQFVMQQLKIAGGDVSTAELESNHTALNLQVSRRFSLFILNITPYVGAGIESSDLSVSYTVTGSGDQHLDGTQISLDMDGKNKGRLTAGLRLGLMGIFTINADYSISKYSAYSVGVGLTLR